MARRPGLTCCWTENWPFEPPVGNTPTTNTFRWTWISFCFTFFAFGVVLFIYEFFLNNPDDAPALKVTTDNSKAIIRRLTSKNPSYSYFSGCSDGGREALMEGTAIDVSSQNQRGLMNRSRR